MDWVDYIEMAAQHSKGNAQHWFRYLRKDIDKYGIVFSKQDIEKLSGSEYLTPFQRVSIRAAFQEGSPTQRHIISLNSKADLNKIKMVRGKFEKSKPC